MATAHLEAVGVDAGRQSFEQVRMCRVRMLLLPLFTALRAEGVQVDEKVDESEFGESGWVIDPEGNKAELWQPPAGQ